MFKKFLSQRLNKALFKELLEKCGAFPPGHYYSPIPERNELLTYDEKMASFFFKPDIYGVNLQLNEQLILLERFSKYYHEIPFPEEKNSTGLYYYNNKAYTYSDAIFLYSVMREIKPKKIIEIGSGYSTCVMLDVNKIFFEGKIEITCVEPYADLDRKLTTDFQSVNFKIFENKLQDFDIKIFKQLEKNDIIFVDSTHVSKYQSDVNHIFFNILPQIKSGIFIHFHDIFYPFEYPKEWLLKGHFWNEAYLLRSF